MYLIRNINIKCKKFKNNPLENPVNFTRSLRISLARHNIDIDYSQVNYPIRQCGVCNSTITPNQYLFKYKAISTDIFDMEFDKHKYDKEYGIDELNIHNKKKDTMSESFHIKKYGDDYKYHLL